MLELINRNPAHHNPSRQINRVARLITRHFDRKLAAIGLNVAYLSVIGALREKEQLSQKELINIGQIGQSAMAQMLERMVNDGLLQRFTDPTDKRKSLFSLSEKTHRLLPELGEILTSENARIFSPLGAAGLEALTNLLWQLEQQLKTETRVE